MPRKNFVIAIDGPAGAGKSTIAKLVAHELSYKYVDTGAMYRAITWKALEQKISFQSPEELTRLAKTAKVRFSKRNDIFHVFVDGKEVTHHIRTQRVTRMTNTLAAVKGVRRILRQRQREMGRAGGVIMEGRDIGTAVFPDADLKIYLDASPMERAERRYKELRARNVRVNLHDIAEAIRQRDYKDRTRGISPLKVAPNALVMDTTNMSQHDVVQFILTHVRNLELKRSNG